LPESELPIEELPGWRVFNSQEPLHIADWNQTDSFPRLKQLLAAKGADNQNLGSAIRVPLTTPHRRLGTLGIISDAGTAYSPEDIGLLQLIARVVGFAIDDGLNLKRAQTAQASLQQQNDRLRLLLNLTTSITKNLELKEVLRAIAAHIREVMRCDAANISLPGPEPGTFRVFALDFPGRRGFAQEELLVTETEDSPARLAFETLKPVIWSLGNAPPGSFGRKIAAVEGFQTICFIPLVNRGHAVGNLVLARTTEDTFTQEDVEFLSQAAGQIAIAIENALAYREISELKAKLAQEKLYLEEEIRSEMNFEQIVGNSPELKHVLQLVETVAPNDSTVLLLGETGTGKELIARAIHDRSRRKERTFVKLNCAAIPTGLLESELFGHEKGAFTGAISQKTGRMELADQGTLFLDEVGDIPTEIQPKLLRALQEREFERLGSTHTRKVNIRLIAATNRDLEKMVANREFRSDLFYRLNVFPIRIPPLRDRREDIPLLVSYFVQKFAEQMQKRIDAIPVAVMKGLTAWEWPGNIRELENFIERAVILTRGKSLEAPLSELRRPTADTPAATASHPAGDDIARIVKETISALNGKKVRADEFARKQREAIVRALTESKGRVPAEQRTELQS
jgi:formate hydrogenlyase transcriptional activator